MTAVGGKLRPFRVTDPDYDLTRVTDAERLLLWRFRQWSERRKRTGDTRGRNGSALCQTEAAQVLGIPLKAYSNLEQGERATLSAAQTGAVAAAVATVRPTLAELCFLARRRSGLSIRQVEEEAGVSRVTFHARERASETQAFWEERGFKFPRPE